MLTMFDIDQERQDFIDFCRQYYKSINRYNKPGTLAKIFPYQMERIEKERKYLYDKLIGKIEELSLKQKTESAEKEMLEGILNQTKHEVNRNIVSRIIQDFFKVEDLFKYPKLRKTGRMQLGDFDNN